MWESRYLQAKKKKESMRKFIVVTYDPLLMRTGYTEFDTETAKDAVGKITLSDGVYIVGVYKKVSNWR